MIAAGSVIDMERRPVSVAITVRKGRIADVQAKLPEERPRTLTPQSARAGLVSGATHTSAASDLSLQGAIGRARLAAAGEIPRGAYDLCVKGEPGS